MINSLTSHAGSVEVGVDGVTRITLTDHGSDKTTIYRVDKEDSSYYLGLLHPHQVGYEEEISNE